MGQRMRLHQPTSVLYSTLRTRRTRTGCYPCSRGSLGNAAAGTTRCVSTVHQKPRAKADRTAAPAQERALMPTASASYERQELCQRTGNRNRECVQRQGSLAFRIESLGVRAWGSGSRSLCSEWRVGLRVESARLRSAHLLGYVVHVLRQRNRNDGDVGPQSSRFTLQAQHRQE
eukprot:2246415-Rhodomonas_salina.1